MCRTRRALRLASGRSEVLRVEGIRPSSVLLLGTARTGG